MRNVDQFASGPICYMSILLPQCDWIWACLGFNGCLFKTTPMLGMIGWLHPIVLCECSRMTSSNENISRVTGPLQGEFTGHRWIPLTKASNAPALLALCKGNSPVTGEFPSQRPVTRNFDAFYAMCLNKQLSKQSWGWWPSRVYDGNPVTKKTVSS